MQALGLSSEGCVINVSQRGIPARRLVVHIDPSEHTAVSTRGVIMFNVTVDGLVVHRVDPLSVNRTRKFQNETPAV